MINILKESIEIHDKLNPKVWDGDKLNSEVRSKVLEIVDKFNESVEIPMEIVDIHILGSNASYNYTQYSDLDVHIIVNFEMMNASKEILQAMYNAEKTNFNDNYDISIHNINVEIYVEDVKANTVSNGIYSVNNDEWIKYPQKLDNIQDIELEPELSELISEINNIINFGKLSDVKLMINSLYLLRKNSLAVDGEYGQGNQIFKEIRNQGLLKDLKDRMYELESKKLSLENRKLFNINKI